MDEPQNGHDKDEREAPETVFLKGQFQREIWTFLLFAAVSILVGVGELTPFIVIYAVPDFHIHANVALTTFEDITPFFIASVLPAILELILAGVVSLWVISYYRTRRAKPRDCMSRVPSMISRKKNCLLHIFLMLIVLAGGCVLIPTGLLLEASRIPGLIGVSCGYEPSNQTVTCVERASGEPVFAAHPVDSVAWVEGTLSLRVTMLFAMLVIGLLKNFLATGYMCMATCCCGESESTYDIMKLRRGQVNYGALPRNPPDQLGGGAVHEM